jgi:hypothetical protein
MRTRICLTIALTTLGVAYTSVHAQARAAGALSMQRYTLCASSSINASTFGRLESALHTRLLATAGIHGAQATRASSRCLTVSVEATGTRTGAVEAAGKIGSVAIAYGGRTHLTLGEHVRLVCPRTGCSTDARAGNANPAARPPILSVVVGDRDFMRGSAAAVFGEGGIASVTFRLVPKAANTFCAFTGSHVHRFFAYVIDGSMVSNPQVQSAICGGFALISPFPAANQAYEVAGYLNSGPLPVPLQLQP